MNLTVNILQTDFSTTSNLNVDIGGISINGDTNGGVTNTHTVVVTDGTIPDITVAQTGFHSYSISPKVYDEDLTLDIVLVPVINDILNPNYNRAYPAFFIIQDPCSFNVDVYNASSYSTNRSWYWNNTLLTQHAGKTQFTINACDVGEYQVKQRVVSTRTEGDSCPTTITVWDNQFGTILTGNTVAEDIDPIGDYLALDTTTNITVVEFRPSLSFSYSVPENQVDSTCCYAQYEEVTVTPSYTLPGTGEYTLNWKVTNADGVVVVNTAFPIQGFDPSTAVISFSFDTLGAYTIEATILDVDCETTFTWTDTLEGCDFLDFYFKGCQSYELSNKSLTTSVTFTVEEYGKEVVVSSTNLPPNTYSTITLPSVGMYIVRVSYTLEGEVKERIYNIAEYCALEDCISSFITNVLCGDTRECECDYTLSTELDSMRAIALSQTYFMHLHETFSLNNFYTALEDADIKNITDAQQILEKLTKMCNRISCLSDGCGGCTEPVTINRTAKGNGDCGCGCGGSGNCK